MSPVFLFRFLWFAVNNRFVRFLGRARQLMLENGFSGPRKTLELEGLSKLEGREIWTVLSYGAIGVALFNKYRLEDPGLADCDVIGRHFEDRDLKGIDLRGMRFSCCTFSGVDLSSADLRGASFSQTTFYDTKLGRANLDGAQFFEAHFTKVRANGARFVDSFWYRCFFSEVEFKRSLFRGANFRRTESFGSIKWSSRTRFGDVCTDGVRFDNEPALQKHIEEEQVVREFERNHVVWAFFWRLTSYYSRSFGTWLGLSLFIAFIFGVVFSDAECFSWVPDWMSRALSPEMGGAALEKSGNSAFSPYYFSMVTFTTLGFGDAFPKDLCGEIYVVVEVVLGYLMLGALLAMLGGKFIRR